MVSPEALKPVDAGGFGVEEVGDAALFQQWRGWNVNLTRYIEVDSGAG
jgi:hypothetical protein